LIHFVAKCVVIGVDFGVKALEFGVNAFDFGVTEVGLGVNVSQLGVINVEFCCNCS